MVRVNYLFFRSFGKSQSIKLWQLSSLSWYSQTTYPSTSGTVITIANTVGIVICIISIIWWFNHYVHHSLHHPDSPYLSCRSTLVKVQLSTFPEQLNAAIFSTITVRYHKILSWWQYEVTVQMSITSNFVILATIFWLINASCHVLHTWLKISPPNIVSQILVAPYYLPYTIRDLALPHHKVLEWCIQTST